VYRLTNSGKARQNDLGIIPIAAQDKNRIIGTVGLISASGSIASIGMSLCHGCH
jgi:hypothetical protein